nr:MAG TPA: ThiF family [Caudoviricetes sp.]
METNDINNPNNNETTSLNITDNDVNDILEENGITEDEGILDPEFEEIPEENYYDENQGEGNDDLDIVPTPPTEPTSSTEPKDPTSTPLPLNSPSLLVDEATTRFSGASWFDEIQKSRVIIAGIGGIGSNVAFQLARMAPANITLYDDDVVERVNMAGQLYSTNDIGQRKVDAIASMISAYTLTKQVNAVPSKFTDSTEAGDIMICGFDNMAARKIFYNSWKRHVQTLTSDSRAKCLFLDGRLSIDTLQIFCIQGDDKVSMDRYETEFLFSDFQAEHTICSMKQTTYLACMIGSLMVNLFTNFIANSLNPVIPYDLPFFTEYDSPNMLFKTQS